MSAYRNENQWIVKRTILGKEITICIPNRVMNTGDNEKILEYIQKQEAYWTNKIQTNRIQPRVEGSRQKLINEKKAMKRGDGKKYKIMTWEEKKEENYRINRAIYNIKCKYENVKKSKAGYFYIVQHGVKQNLIKYGEEFLTYSDAAKRPLKAMMKERFKAAEPKNFDGFEEPKTMSICEEGLTNLWREAGKFGFSKLSGIKNHVQEIEQSEFLKLLPCEVEFEFSKGMTGEAVFINSYDIEVYLEAVENYRPARCSSELWRDYCYVAQQIYVGCRCKDPVAMLLAPMYPVPEEVAKLLTLFSPVVLPDSGLTIYYAPHMFDCQGSRFCVYNMSYVNMYVKPTKVCYAWSYDNYKDNENVTSLEVVNNYLPGALINFVEERKSSMMIFKTGFSGIALYLAATLFDDKDSFSAVNKYIKQVDLIVKLYSLLRPTTISEISEDSPITYDDEESSMGMEEVCVKTDTTNVTELNVVLQSLISEIKIEMSDVVGLTSSASVPIATVGFTPG